MFYLRYLFIVWLCTGLLWGRPVAAQMVETSPASGLSKTIGASPGDLVPIYTVGLLGDGSTRLDSLRIELSRPGGTGSGEDHALDQLLLYRSTNRFFDQGDVRVGGQQRPILGGPSKIALDSPESWDLNERFYIVVAQVDSLHREGTAGAKEAFEVTAPAGNIHTSAGAIGTAVQAGGDRRLVIDVKAIRLVFARLPADSGAIDPRDEVVSGRPFAVQPRVEAQDDFGNVDVDFNGPLVLGLQMGQGHLTGEVERRASGGSADYAGSQLAYTSAGIDGETFTLKASTSTAGLTQAFARFSADIVATRLAFGVSPGSAGEPQGTVLSGAPFPIQPVVKGVDDQGALDEDFTGEIELFVQVGQGRLKGMATTRAEAGTASFGQVGYIAASDWEQFQIGVRSSSQPLVEPGLAQDLLTADVRWTQLGFGVVPADPSARRGQVVNGRVFPVQPVVEAQDAYGVRDTNFQGRGVVRLWVEGDQVELVGETSATWSKGGADFAAGGLAVRGRSDGQQFTLWAEGEGFEQAASETLQVDAVATQLVFAQPAADQRAAHGDVWSGVAFARQPVVEARDALDVVDVDFADVVRLSVEPPGQLSGGRGVAAVAGRAHFENVSYEATVDHEIFQLQADDEAGGAEGDLPVGVDGRRRIADAVANQVGFAVSPGDPDAVYGDVRNGKVFPVQPVLEAQDGLNVRDVDFHSSEPVVLSADGAQLKGEAESQWANGRADFSGKNLHLLVPADETVFSLTGSSQGLEDAVASLRADVVATKVAFSRLPGDSTAVHGDVRNGKVFPVQPVLEAQDDSGVRDMHFAGGTASLEIQSGTVSLLGRATALWQAGQIDFSGHGLTVAGDADGQTFVLVARDQALAGEATSQLQIDALATRLVFVASPAQVGVAYGDVVSDKPFQVQPVVQAQDARGVVDIHFADEVSLSVPSPGQLRGGVRVRAVGGTARFTDVGYRASADHEAFQLVADDEPGGVEGDLAAVVDGDRVSADVVAVMATQIGFAVLPEDDEAQRGHVVSGRVFPVQPVLEAQDARGVRDLDHGGQVRLSIEGTAKLVGQTTVVWQSGKADFTGLGLAVLANEDQERFRLVAEDVNLGRSVSPNLIVDVVATKLGFVIQPAHPEAFNGDVVSGRPFQNQPVVQAQNSEGVWDVDVNDGTVVVECLGEGVRLDGQTRTQWTAGQARFGGLSVSARRDGATFRLGAKFGALAGTSAVLAVDVVGDRLGFAALPADPLARRGQVVNGRVFPVQPVVEAQDAYGVRDTDFQGRGAVRLWVGGDQVELVGETRAAWRAGLADFAAGGLAVKAVGRDSDGQQFTLWAGSEAFDQSVSDTLQIDAVATQLVFVQSAADQRAARGDVWSGVAFARQPVVEARDALDVVDVDFADVVRLSVEPPGQLSGGRGVAAVAGRAHFENVSYEATVDHEIFQLQADDEAGGAEGDLPVGVDGRRLVADVVATGADFKKGRALDGGGHRRCRLPGREAPRPELCAQPGSHAARAGPGFD